MELHGVPVPTVDDAVAASTACAAALGLPVRSTRVIAAGYSVRVLLEPVGVVTRVVTEGRVMRGDPLPWLCREVEVARFLAASGAPVVPPFDQPGPHRAGGLDVTLWRWLPHADGVAEPRALAALLFELHEHLLGYGGALPVLSGPLTDIGSALRLSDDPLLHRVAERLLPEVSQWPTRPLHGDLHTGNLLSTARGYRWLDFEDVCRGPLEWDFASTTITDEVVAAYPGALDPDLLRRCRQLRRLQILAAIVTADPARDEEALRVEITRALAADFG